MSDIDPAALGSSIGNAAGKRAPVGEERPTQIRQFVLALACGISFLLYLHRYTWGTVKKNLIDDFGWDTVTLGWLDGLFALTYGIAQIPSGMLCDWFGSRALLGTSILLWSLALGGFAVAKDVASMTAARLIFGVAQAGCYPVLNKVSKNWFPISTRTTAQGWIATFFGRGGGAVSFVLFGTVMLGWWSMPWRWAIAVFSLVGIASGIAFVLLFRNTPREHPWANDAEARLIVAHDAAAAQAKHSRVRWSTLLGSASVWFLFVRALASNMADVLYVYWVPLYLLNEKQLSHVLAGWLAALPLIGGALGGVCSGRLQSELLQRNVGRHWVRRSVGLFGKLLAAGCMLLSLAFHSPVAVLLMFLVVKFFSDAEQPAEWGAVSDIAGRNAATVFACVNTVGALGGFIASLQVGHVLKSFGWTAVFVIIAIEYVVAGLAWLFIDTRRLLDDSQAAH